MATGIWNGGRFRMQNGGGFGEECGGGLNNSGEVSHGAVWDVRWMILSPCGVLFRQKSAA